MQLKLFETKALAEFDGGAIAGKLNAELKKAIEDCQARPTEKKVRKVVLQIELEPATTDNTGEAVRCAVRFQCQARLPTAKTDSYLLQLRKNGTLAYSEEELHGDS